MQVEYLIIGGGILGQSIAWELSSKVGGENIVLLEKSQCSQGTTSQAAALVTQGRNKLIASSLVKDTLTRIDTLRSEYDEDIPFHSVGGLHIAFTHEEFTALEVMHSIAKELGIRCEWLTAQECQAKCPLFELTHAIGGLYFFEDGYVDGPILADTFGRLARRNGATVLSGHQVSNIFPTSHGYQVKTESIDQSFEAKHIILCAGPWAASLLKDLSVLLPVTPMRSLYWITESCLDESNTHPVCMAPKVHGYFRPELDSLLFGLRDEGIALHPDHVPDDVHGFKFPDGPEGIETLEKNWDSLSQFWPDLHSLGLTSEITGISSYSPDGLPVIGTPKNLEKFTIVSGCSGAGIAYCGGIAKHAVNHVLHDEVPNELDLNRFEIGDAYDEAFRQSCLLARSQKTAG